MGRKEQRKQDCALKAFVRLAAKIGWDYLLRFKDGRIPSVAEEYQAIPEKIKAGNAEFQWSTSLQITEKNAEKMVTKGKLRDEHFSLEKKGIERTIKKYLLRC